MKDKYSNPEFSKTKILRLGQCVKVLHYYQGKNTDSCVYFLQDIAIWQEKQSILKVEWVLVRLDKNINPKFEVSEGEPFIVKNGEVIGYYKASIGSSYEKREKISRVNIVKIFSPSRLRDVNQN